MMVLQAAKVNREKGLSARGSKMALAGSSDAAGPGLRSLYMDTISADVVRDADVPVPVSAAAGSRVQVPLSAAARAAVRLTNLCFSPLWWPQHRCTVCMAPLLALDFVAMLLQFCTSRVEAISNKKMAVDSNLSLEQELL